MAWRTWSTPMPSRSSTAWRSRIRPRSWRAGAGSAPSRVERAVGTLDRGAQPAVLGVVEDLRLLGRRALHHEAPQVGVLEHGHEEGARPRAPLGARHERPTGGRDRGTSRGPDRIGVPPRSALAGDRRPAVVLPRLEDVDLVVAVGAVLDLERRAAHRLEGEALRIAVAPRVHDAAAGRAGEHGVVGRDAAVLLEPQDLAVERVGVLRARAVAGLAHRDPELAIRSESHPAAVVVRGGDHAAPDDEDVERRDVPAHPVAEDLVAPLSLVVARRAQVHEAVRGEVRIESDAHEPGLALRVDARDGRGP